MLLQLRSEALDWQRRVIDHVIKDTEKEYEERLRALSGLEVVSKTARYPLDRDCPFVHYLSSKLNFY